MGGIAGIRAFPEYFGKDDGANDAVAGVDGEVTSGVTKSEVGDTACRKAMGMEDFESAEGNDVDPAFVGAGYYEPSVEREY